MPRKPKVARAHELSHVAHRDVTVAGRGSSVLAILAGFMMRSAMWGTMGRNRDNNVAIMVFAVTIVGVVVYFLSFILMRALSRYPLGADRGAALLTKPSPWPRAAEDLRRDGDHPHAHAPDGAGQRLRVRACHLGGRKGIDLATIFATPRRWSSAGAAGPHQAQLGER
ncbi:MAG: M48 family metalloprotease [Candidatus Nanopelagicales bacterium]